MFLKRKISYRKYFFLLAGFSMVIVLSSIILAVYTILNTNRSLTALDNSHEAGLKLFNLMSTLEEAESGQRGYLLTGDPVFWESYKKSSGEVEKDFSEVYDLLHDKQELKIDLDLLKEEIHTRMKLLFDNKNYFDKVRMVNDSLKRQIANGRMIMERLRHKVGAFEQFNEKQLAEVHEKTFRSSRLSVYIIILTCGLSLLMLISILVVLNREYQSKAAIERELIESEKLLQQQVHKLHLSNKELEQFAYVASHDLQEPLRKIISFSEKIQSKLGNYHDEEVVNCLKRLTTSADRMRVLINDLLNYSRATRAIDINEEVNLDETFRVILEDLGEIIQTKKAVVTTMKLGSVKGNKTQLRQLFQNLVSNALKFNETDPPTVSIWGEEMNANELHATEWGKDLILKHSDYFCLFVLDNGIGFDPQYLSQIFIIFQRLHGRSEYEGTGIGLAICKRIIENHEGFITAMSSEGKGAMFMVGLPKIKTKKA
ncbi:MAG TPA: ATP-binding protein [Bacteroidia bacterium]